MKEATAGAGGDAREQEPKIWAEFLESVPPGVLTTICADAVQAHHGASYPHWKIPPQDLQLHCGSALCGGTRVFFTDDDIWVEPGKLKDATIDYACRNCRQKVKTYALRVLWKKDGEVLRAVKFGEIPAFGPPVPARVISLIGPDRELFLRGRRAENLGLGIGAFAYYRRVVENQKERLIREIGRVAARLGAGPDVIASFERAVGETQFSRAIEEIKGGIPPVLLLDGHNPLSLLHTALSEGLHEHSDEDCLQLAESVRLVLTELAERISQALRDEAELKNAVGRLLNRQKNNGQDGGTEQTV